MQNLEYTEKFTNILQPMRYFQDPTVGRMQKIEIEEMTKDYTILHL
jgi:hypothetical protein